MSFEVRHSDLAARIGKIETMHGAFETPVFIPVIHPVKQIVDTKFLEKLGFKIVITNAYTTLKYYGTEACERGIHDIINYNGVVMTDSGGYQVLRYGSVEVNPQTMAAFQKDISSDIAVPLDKPTGYGLSYELAKEYVQQTLNNARETLDTINEAREEKIESQVDDNCVDTIWVGPIQGAEHSGLVKYSAESLDTLGFKIMALGSPVELMEAYEFALLAQMIAATKRAIPTKPIHLFGAGHPLTIPLIVALGCDMFDSASYVLYAKEDRYLHANGTSKLQDLSYFPCQCPTCLSYTVKELLDLDKEKRTAEVANHNLYMLQAEVSIVKQTIVDGRLWEYVMQKAHAHPKVMEALELLKNFEFLEYGTPLFKGKALFMFDPLDQYRPEAKRFRRMVSNFRSPKYKRKRLVLYPELDIHPFYSSTTFVNLTKKFPDAQICTYSPFLGIIPVEISDIFPAAHNLIPRKTLTNSQAKDYPTFIDSLNRFLIENGFEEVMIVEDHFILEVIEKISTQKPNLKVLRLQE